MAQQLRVATILWFALLFASLLYPGILVSLRSTGLEPPPPDFALAPAFYAVALVAAVMSFVLPRIKYAATLKPFASRVEAVAGGAAPWPGYRSKVEGERVLRLQAGDLRALVGGFVTALILALAMSEAVSLLGFVLGFLGFPAPVWAPLSAAGPLLIALRFPSERAVLGPLERAHGARAVLDEATG
ncbi:MAG TPA: hypothetical protein VFS43_44190 [Polyangiaceae bacterium]|nr:hypothetical protein [Polyangiaceae bacterium]